MSISKESVHATCVLLFRAREELAFSVAVQFSFVITGKERERRRGRKKREGRFLTKPDSSISLSFFPEAATRIDLCSPFLSYRNIQRVTGSL